MKTNRFKKIIALAVIASFGFWNLTQVNSLVYADPPEGRGSDRAHEVTQEINRGTTQEMELAREISSQSAAASLELVNVSIAESGSQSSHEASEGNLPIADQIGSSGSLGNDSIQDLIQQGSERALELANLEMSEIGIHESNPATEHARWDYNPIDDRPQGNHGNVEMLDPYGFARDNRLELDGDRGRPFRLVASPDVVPCYLTSEVTSSEVSEPIAELVQPIESEPLTTTLTTSTVSYDLSRIISYAEAYRFVYYPGDTVQYDLALTNPYDTPLTFSVSATIEYMNVVWVYNPDLHTYQRENLVGDPVQGESTEYWESVTLQPGETVVLYDSYYMPTTAYWSNYQFDVTLTNLSSGETYNDPAAGWFDPPLDIAGVHRENLSTGG
jgi:hypothetical protein